ncbi:hypothetical protein I9T54_07780, partial [Campylobacter peloridis]
FHLIDFSEELKNKRLYVVEQFNKENLKKLLREDLNVKNYLQNSMLLLHCSYYQNNLYENISLDIKNLCSYLVNDQGNSYKSSLQGITQL